MITNCIGTNNSLEYLKLAVKSVRKNHYFQNSPLIVCAENCVDGTNEWLEENKENYKITPMIISTEENDEIGIGGGMNLMADQVQTEYINFIHADMYVAPNQDLELYRLLEGKDDPIVASSFRIQPRVFPGDTGRPGTLIVDNDMFGELARNFNEDLFDEWAIEFSSLNDYMIPKGEGVSFMIRKEHWDRAGGNDPQFNPLSFDDMDLFLRMRRIGYKFILTSKSVVYHFGSRSANGHFPGDNIQSRSGRQEYYEQRNFKRFVNKWGGAPTFDEYEMINGIRVING